MGRPDNLMQARRPAISRKLLSTLRVKAEDGFPLWPLFFGCSLSVPLVLPFNHHCNMKKGKNFIASVFTTFACLVSIQIIAQQDSLSFTGLGDVTITASKFAKSQTETGKVLTIIDENQLKLSAGKDISQLLNEQAGLFINGANSNPGKDKSVYLRGAKSEYTLILLDGIPLNDPSAIGGGAYDLRLIPLDQVERIEILKGNQSTLYGSNAIAGVINIITKKNGRSTANGAMTLSYGSFDTFKGTVGISGGTTKVDYSVGFTRYSTKGISEAKDITDTAGFDNDGFTQNAFNASSTYRPIKNFQVQPFLRFADFDGKYDGGPFMDDTKNVYQSKFFNAGITSQYQMGKGNIQAYYGYDKTNRSFIDGTYGPTDYKSRFHHSEVFMNYDFNSHIQLLSGASFQSWRMRDELATKKNPRVMLISPYASLFVRNVKGFSAEFGGRFNYHTKYGNNFTYSFNPSYLVNEKAKLFLNISSGFKAPSLQQLYGQFGRNENLRPEKSQSLEGGVQFFFKHKKMDVRVVAFARKIEHVISTDSNFKYINLDKQKDEGFDLEGTWAINTKWKVRSFYSYVNGRVVTSDSSISNLYRIPRHSLGFNLSWQVVPSWLISTNFKSVGKRNDLFFNGETFTNEHVGLNGYQLLDLYSEYSTLKGKLKIFIDVKNVLNQKYYEVYGYSVLPISVNGGIRVDF
jgi:vitamin B12 transporter